MGARGVIAMLLLAAVLISGGLCAAKAGRVGRDMLKLIDNETRRVKSGEPLETDEFERLESLWEKNRSFFGGFVPREKLDELQRCLLEAESYLTAGEAGEYLAALEKLGYAVRVIKDFDLPLLINIF